eukprot:403331544
MRSHSDGLDFEDQRQPLIETSDKIKIVKLYIKILIFQNDLIEQRRDSQKQSSEHNLDDSDKKDIMNQLTHQCKGRIEAANLEKGAATEQVPYSKLLMTYADRTDKLLMISGYICSFTTGAGMPVMVFLMGDIINTFQGGQLTMVEALKPTIITLVIIGLFIWLVTYLYYVQLVILSERIGKKTRVAYLKAILSQDIAWFDSINATELSSRLSIECQAIQKSLGEKMGALLLSIGMSISGMFLAFFRGWLMSLILLGAFPFVIILLSFTGKAMQKGFKANLQSYGQSAGYAEQALNAIKVVQAFGQEKTEMKNYDKFLGRARKAGIKSNITGAVFISFLMLIIFGYYGYAFYTGSWLVEKQVWNPKYQEPYNAGDIMSCLFGVVFGIKSLGMATPNIKAIAEGKVAGKMAYDIIDRVPKIKIDEVNAQKLKNIKGRIELKNVTFTYPSRPEQKVLDNFSAVFEEGKTTAIVGASGSGKSTIIQLLERFYDPDQGDVYIDGQNLKEINLKDYRSKVGYVSQEPILFNTSIKANLLYCKPTATDVEVIEALKSANAWDFINEKMGKDGIYTNVGNSGGQLSGGQKQRIAIARAFIKKPKILLLDEATSALDKRNEREVQTAIDKIREELGHITTVVIAHRLSTIRHADNIIVMNKGKITEEGNHEELLRQYPEGIYSKFVNEQESSDEMQQNNILMEESLVGHTGLINLSKDQKSQQRVNVDPVLEALEKQMQQNQDEIDKQKDLETQIIKKAHSQKNNFKRMIRMSYPKINIFFGLISALGQGSLMPIFSIVMVKVIFALNVNPFHGVDQVRKYADFYCLMILIIAISAFMFAMIQNISFGLIGENVTLKIRQLLYFRILQKNIGWFDEKDNAPGVITSTMANDAQIIRGVSAEGLAMMIQAGFSVLAGIVIGFVYNWREALVCIGCVPFIILGAGMGMKLQKGFSEDSDQALKEANLLAGDAILNYRTVAAFGYEDQIVKDYDSLLEGPVQIAKKNSHKIGLSFGFTQFIQYGVPALLYYAGGLFIDNGYTPATDADKLFTAILAMMMGAMASGQAQQFGPDLGKAKQAAAKIFGIVDVPSEINAVEQPDVKNKKKILNDEDFQGEIEFQDVWFRYPTRKNDWVLKGLNMKINAKETVALVGESGCGKSTTVSLIFRFYDVNHGQILIDGVDIKEYNLQDLRRAMGLVMQEPILFNYTIMENILYGNSTATNKEIYESANIANAMEFIESKQIINTFDDSAEVLLRELINQENELIDFIGDKDYREMVSQVKQIMKEEEKKGKFQSLQDIIDERPEELKNMQMSKGFQVDCGIKGCKLSGGQKQRIAIARAIIRKPKMLILDEATSALDEASQRKVQVALDNIMKDRTSIVIAHRLSTVEKCDRILVLESGRLVEEGGFQELKQKDGGIFANLASGMQTKQQ